MYPIPTVFNSNTDVIPDEKYSENTVKLVLYLQCHIKSLNHFPPQCWVIPFILYLVRDPDICIMYVGYIHTIYIYRVYILVIGHMCWYCFTTIYKIFPLAFSQLLNVGYFAHFLEVTVYYSKSVIVFPQLFTIWELIEIWNWSQILIDLNLISSWPQTLTVAYNLTLYLYMYFKQTYW